MEQNSMKLSPLFLRTLLFVFASFLVLSIITGTMSYFSSSDLAENQTQLGQVLVELDTVYPATDVSLVPNNVYSGTAKVVNSAFTNNAFFVRVKVDINTTFLAPTIEYTDETDRVLWIEHTADDGLYYYYVGALASNQEANLISNYYTTAYNGDPVDKEGNVLTSVKINIEAEAVQDHPQACFDAWGEENLPYSWVEAMVKLGYDLA